MPAAARIGDPFSCGDHVAAGSPNVFFDNIPATRLGDATTGHGCWNANALAEANSVSVFANNIPISVLGNSNQVHCCPPGCHQGALSSASPTTFIGG